jgi:hypothetical protein
MMMDFRDQFAQSLGPIVKDTFLPFKTIEKYMQDWQNPTQADKLLYVEQ